MKYFYFEADVAGGLGPCSIVHEAPGQLVVEKLHYVFEGWPSDEILESTPCYIVTTRLADKIKANGLTGISFDQVETSCSGVFRELHPDKQLPPFVWMRVAGAKGRDDFFFAGYGRLVVSERALRVIGPHAASATVREFRD